MSKKKKLVLLCGVFVVFILSAGLYYLYCSYNPDIRIGAGSGGKEDYHIQPLTVLIIEHHNIPSAKSISKNLRELGDWDDKIVTDLMLSENYIAPTDVKAFGEIRDGKTVLRYEGFVTTKDGVRKDYKEEKVFDFVLDPDMDLEPIKNDSLKKNGFYYALISDSQKDIPSPPAITIRDNKIIFYPHLLSSYILFGDYKIDGDKLSFEDEEGILHVFTISGDKLIFQEGSHLEKFIKKGTEFVFKEESN
ncbi:hypothetical protein SAMN02745248_01203 [Hathewaya proteolytica DSM 3090]|uniref:Uncharacterized protein n=1 Tax=Hathewaya proteolytica DSM 3090 TaxID=1121331 RepID=A0A1M6MWI8_9CLOT|nr:hypothetical protein [Hathewaya proteolytica]SHJ87779.1 hypothetical protein SAMN02745248_01203 [Hathewaya proteolytica DSM 3090]